MIHRALSKMVPSSWGPLDLFDFLRVTNGGYIAKVHDAVKILKVRGTSAKDVDRCFASPSSLRCALWFAMLEWRSCDHSDPDTARETLEYLVAILERRTVRDMWALESNVVHTDEQIADILEKTPWVTGTPQAARELGKFTNSVWSWSFSLYRDFFPQEAFEMFLPYDASKKFGEGTTLLIKDFTSKIKPVELWPDIGSFRYGPMKIYQVYRNVRCSCEFIGMHPLYEGDLMNGLAAYAVEIGDTFVGIDEAKSASEYIALAATKQSQVYETMSKNELKEKFLEWLDYQFFDLFKLAEIDWRPSEELRRRVRKEEVRDRLEIEAMPPYEKFVDDPDWEIYWLKQLYTH